LKHNEKIIFQEIPEEINEDWIHGSLFGGMGSVMNNFDMAKSFRKAAESLILRNNQAFEAFEVQCPLLYLYRHAIELYLKGIIKRFGLKNNVKNLRHDLSEAFSLVKDFLQTHDYKIPDTVEKLILEFAELDEKSFLFRYGEGAQPGEFWIDFIQLKDKMGWLFDGFENIYSIKLK